MIGKNKSIMCQTSGHVYAINNGFGQEEKNQENTDLKENTIGQGANITTKVGELCTVLDSSMFYSNIIKYYRDLSNFCAN